MKFYILESPTSFPDLEIEDKTLYNHIDKKYNKSLFIEPLDQLEIMKF